MLFLEIILQPCISLIGWREYCVSVFDSIDLLCKKYFPFSGRAFTRVLTPKHLQQLQIYISWSGFVIMEWRPARTRAKVMVKTNGSNKAKVRGAQIEEVDSFEYLGNTLSKDNNSIQTCTPRSQQRRRQCLGYTRSSATTTSGVEPSIAECTSSFSSNPTGDLSLPRGIARHSRDYVCAQQLFSVLSLQNDKRLCQPSYSCKPWMA